MALADDEYRLEDLIDIQLCQDLQDRLNKIYSFPSAIIDNDSRVLTATAWQDLCTRFHRAHPECVKLCEESDRYILEHIQEADPAVCYRCPHGLVDTATPIVVAGQHLGNFFTGQFFLDPPDLDFFRNQAHAYGFDEAAYLDAARRVPIWSQAQLDQYLQFIKGFTEILSGMATHRLQELRAARLRHQRRSKLQEMSVFNQQLIESVDEGIIVYGPDLRYELWNAYMERLSGRPADEVVGRHPLEIFPFLKEVGVLDCVARALRGQRGNSVEYQHTDLEGGERWILDTTSPLLGLDGSVVGAIATVRDVTAARTAERERELLQRQVAQAQRLESVGRLAGGVAHDFNNILSVIMGHADLALMSLDSQDPICSDLHEILRAARRSAELTRQLLGFARKQTAAPEVLDLNEVVSGLLAMIRRLIGEEIEIRFTPGPGIGSVEIDPTQVDQILVNLCVNARDAIAGVGRITLETRNAEVPDSGEAQSVPPGHYVLLLVADDGCGMSPDVLDHLFEPFFTTKGLGKGTGLGLATVYGIIRQNLGFVDVTSTPGNGTLFSIYLPRSDRPASEAAAPVGQPGPVIRRADALVLLVEDELSSLNVSRRLLEACGCRVLGASTPSEALGLIERYRREINLLVTDVVMPEMNGLELATACRAILPDLPCLFISGYPAEAIADRGILAQGIQFVAKPFTRDEIHNKVYQLLAASPRR